MFLQKLRILHRNVWALGFASFFNDISNQMISTLLPLYMHSALKTPQVTIGLIEGLTLLFSSSCKLISGMIADRFADFLIPLISTGYFVSVVSRPFLTISGNYYIIFMLKILDKLGKSVRGCPRDLLLGRSLKVSEAAHGSPLNAISFGVHHSLETAGGVASLIIAFIVVSLHSSQELSASTYTTIVWLSLPFGLLAVASIICIAVSPEKYTYPYIESSREEQSLLSTPNNHPDSLILSTTYGSANSSPITCPSSFSPNSLLTYDLEEDGTPTPQPPFHHFDDKHKLHIPHSVSSDVTSTDPTSNLPELPSTFSNSLSVTYLLGRKAPRVELPKPTITPSSIFSPPFLLLLVIVFIFQSSAPPPAFYSLFAFEMGIDTHTIVAMLLAHHLMYTISIIPSAFVSTAVENKYQNGRAFVISVGWLLRGVLLYYVSFASSSSQIVWVYILYGVYLGLTESLIKVLVIDVIGETQHLATQLAIYNCVIGFADMIVSVSCGYMFDISQQHYFYRLCGYASLLSVIMLLVWRMCVRKRCSTEGDITCAHDTLNMCDVETGPWNNQNMIVVPCVKIDDIVQSIELTMCKLPVDLLLQALQRPPTSNDLELLKKHAEQSVNHQYKGGILVEMIETKIHRIICVTGIHSSIIRKTKRRNRPGWTWKYNNRWLS